MAESSLEGGPGWSPGPDLPVFHGDAVFAMGGVGLWDGESGLLLEGTTLHGGRTGLFLHGASASLVDATLEDNDVDVWQQDCDGVESVDGDLDDLCIEECPERHRGVLSDLVFDLYLEDLAPSDD